MLRVPSPGFAASREIASVADAGARGYSSKRLGPWRLPARTAVMGVLNVTPDSFSDGGRWLSAAACQARLRALVDAGADIIDVGAESTRPGAAPVAPAEQLQRLQPVLRMIADIPVPLSIDTTSAEVATVCLDAGFEIVNDVSGGEDTAMAPTVARHAAVVVVMHRRGSPMSMDGLADYDDVVAEVLHEWRDKARTFTAAGISASQIWCDPGLGFAKTSRQSWALLRAQAAVAACGHPVLWGPSRKRFTDVCGQPADARDAATHAIVGWLALRGADVVRVHDVAGARQAIAVAVRLAEE